MSTVEDSHYISRFLLRNWTDSSGRLRVFDFTTGRISRPYPDSTYVSPKPFPADVEKWLGHMIESPLGEYVKRLKEEVGKVGRKATPQCNEREGRALVLALLVQSHRTRLSRDNTHIGLEQFAKRDTASLDRIVRLAVEQFNISIRYARGGPLFFPESGLAPYPVFGTFHSCFVPLTPFAFVSLIGHDADPKVLTEMLTMPELPALFSVGLLDDRVVIPPLSPEGVAARGEVADHVRTCRSEVQKLMAYHFEVTRGLGREVPPPLLGPLGGQR